MTYPGWLSQNKRTKLRRLVHVVVVVSVIPGLSVLASLLASSASYTAPAGPARDGHSQLKFVDVASDVGLDMTHGAFRDAVSADPGAMMGGGLCWIDIDRDGWLDLFVTNSWSDGEWGLWQESGGPPTSKLFLNTAGTFTDVSKAWDADLAVRANGCVAADFNGDGYTDLYVTTQRENVLLLNQDGQSFSDRSLESGLDLYGWHTGAAVGDIDGDGLLDVVVAGYADLNNRRPQAQTGFPNTFEPVANSVLLNRGADINGVPQFDDVAAISGMEPHGYEYGLGVMVTDVDNDGDLDIHIANDTQPNRLYRNDLTKTGEFVEISGPSGLDDPNSGMGIASADVNDDQLPDFVVTNLAGQGHASVLTDPFSSIYSDTRFVPGMDAVSALGDTTTGWGSAFGDFDLDGTEDLLVASGAIPIEDLSGSSEAVRYFSNTTTNGPTEFVDMSGLVGLNDVVERNGRAVAVADYDNDGDLDAALSGIGQPMLLLENRSGSGNWISIDLGTPSPGQRIVVTTSAGDTHTRRTVVGSSWLSSEDPRVHVGLGDAEIEKIEIIDLSGDRIQVDEPKRNQILRVER